MHLLKVIKSYYDIDSEIAKSAFQAFRGHPTTITKQFSGHLWYLAQDMLPLCLFSTHLSDETKNDVARAILQSKQEDNFVNRGGNGFGKPLIPQFNMPEVVNMELKDFVGSDSWKFFSVLGMDSSFLCKPVDNWSEDRSCKEISVILQKLQVKNDAAERGVKLGHSFLDRAKIESNYQNILQVVENDRKAKPNQRHNQKTKKEPTDNWFLTWC